MEILALHFWWHALDSICSDTDDMKTFDPIHVMQNSPMHIWSISSIQNFGKFNLLELFHFKFERPLPWDFGRGRTLEYVCQIWEESMQRNQSYEDMKFYLTANAKNPY